MKRFPLYYLVISASGAILWHKIFITHWSGSGLHCGRMSIEPPPQFLNSYQHCNGIFFSFSRAVQSQRLWCWIQSSVFCLCYHRNQYNQVSFLIRFTNIYYDVGRYFSSKKLPGSTTVSFPCKTSKLGQFSRDIFVLIFFHSNFNCLCLCHL